MFDVNKEKKMIKKNLIFFGIIFGLVSTPHGNVYAEICYTKCIGFLQFECGSNKIVAPCAGGWGCPTSDTVGGIYKEGNGAHECLGSGIDDNEQECTSQGGCSLGYKCATWATKKNKCVKTCDKNSDCPSGQKCKKPLGTSFKRCK